MPESTVSLTVPEYKTAAFWFALIAKLLGALAAAGVIGTGSTAERITGIAAAVLIALGYPVVKNAQ